MNIRIIACVATTLLATASFADTPPTTVAIGKAAPDITMTGIDGEPFKLSEITQRGKNVVLVMSRANW